ncbi:hypothetical protein O0880_14390 [Janthinobacterium sp. SUN118]|uniref:hypothetical protein n=1 Tax=Janthinobacterium sp. SUN118 TaxID=3004100 RepID=UPI0025AF635C|nr:hypothetical protein [Janthinobacterium sp. SUN118]MDN2710611.1 hypothetical protein [Janthinobacterium sp. SUN118]
MTLMRLRIDYWTISPAIPLFDEDVDFNSSGIWIKIDCQYEIWKTIHLFMSWQCIAPANIDGMVGHFIIDEVSKCPIDEGTWLRIRLKFFPIQI